MANDWQDILNNFAGSRKSTTSSKSTSSSKASTSGKSTTSSSTTKKKKKDDWQSVLDDFAGTRKTASASNTSSVAERIEARTTVGKEEEEEKKWYEGWFQKGASGESTSKAILGTLADVGEDLTTGLVGIGERAVDAIASIAPYVYQGNLAANGVVTTPEQKKLHDDVVKEMKKENSEFIAKDLYDENKVAKQILSQLYGSAENVAKVQSGSPLAKVDLEGQQEKAKMAQQYLDNQMELDSVLASKSDSLVQSGGQLLGTAALKAMGIPADVVIGLTSYGGEFENALNNGATYDEAALSSAVSAGAEILTEKISGGIKFGGKTLDDVGTQWLAKNVSNKLGRTLLKMGMETAGEGFEEVLSGYASAIGQKLTYMSEKELNELFTKEDKWEAFIGGAALGSVGSATQAVTASANGVDSVTGLTKNEQKVVDKVFKDELANAEKNGKVTQRQKSEIYDRVLEDMEKGYISTDIIEEALGGEKYENYKKAKDWEDSVQKEYDDLRKMKRGDMTGEQIDRETELKRMLDHISQTSNLGQVKAELSKDIYEMTKGDRLVESFFENVRSKQKFEADLSKYEGKARDVIKQVMDSGLADNSNQTHEFWDMAAKIATDRNVDVSLATNDEILEMVKKEYEANGKTFDASNFKGKIIDGYWGENGIVLNAQTKRALNFVLGHEITHSLEKANLYKDLPKLMNDFAPDEYKRRFDERAGQYEGIYEDEGFKEKIEQEVIADMVGDILFTDKDFVKHLSTANRNVFQKMWDEVKYLCKKATAGSKEARQLEALKKKFEDVYREAGKNQGEGKYSLSDVKVPTRVELESKAPVAVVDISKPQTQGSFAERRKAILSNVSDVISKPYLNKDTGALIFLTENSYKHIFSNRGEVQINAAEHLPELVENAVLVHSEKPDHGSEYASGIYTFFAAAKADQVRPVKLKVKEYTYAGQDLPKNIKAYFDSLPEGYAASYDTVVLEVEEIEKSPSGSAKDMNQNDSFLSPDELSTINVADLLQLVKGDAGKYIPKLSLSDSDGKQLSNEQVEYFKDSKVRDTDGNLLPVYHGSKNSGFNVFRYSKDVQTGTDYGEAYYFTSDRQKASGYSYDVSKDERVAKYNADREALKNRFLETRSEEDKNAFLDYRYEGKKLADLIDDESYNTDGGEVKEVYLDLTNPLIVDAGGKYYYEVYQDYFDEARANGNDGIIVKNVIDNPRGEARPIDTYIAFRPEQIKNTDNLKPTSDPDIRKSLSDVGQTHKGRGGWNVYSKYADVAPVAENATQQAEPQLTEDNATVTPAEMEEMFPDEPTAQTELDNLLQEREALESRMTEMGYSGDLTDFESVNNRWIEATARIAELESEISESESGRVNSLDDADAPPGMEAPYYESNEVTVNNPFHDRDWRDVGSQKVKAFMTENPEVKPFFQDAAFGMMYDIDNGTKGERFYNDQLHYESGGEKGWMGVKRHTTDDIADLLDGYGWSYADIQKGLNGILEDKPNAFSKRLEFLLNDRLMNGYTDVEGRPIPPNQDYINLLNEMQINKDAREAFDSLMPVADQYAPEDVAPVKPLTTATPDTMDAPIYQSKDPNTLRGQTTMFEPPKPSPSVATVLTEEAKKEKEKSGVGKKMVSQLVDKGMVFENLSLETGNHELQAKYNYALPTNTEARAQYFMENGADGVKSLKDIMGEVNKTKKTEQFYNYLYHVHNIDRMTLEDRFDNTPNKTVFGETVTADVSRVEARKLEIANPEFRNWANDIYAYNKYLRNLLVEGDVISKETADLWEKMYPHYVPIRRTDSKGQNISVPLDSKKTGVNNPIKRATGGSSDIEPLFETMAMRTEQTFRAIARNSFGIELKNALGTTIGTQENASVDDVIDTIEAQEEKLLKPGTMNSNPTFTVFENGERVEFEITEDMYEALKPAGEILGHRVEALNKVGNFRRNLLTVWNPVFALYRNPIKDMQDVAVNSQHPVKTYLNVPNAIYQMATNGKWATEYDQNGGKSNTYFDSKTNKFKEDSIFKKTIGMPIRAVEAAGEFIEEIPRLAEYIASRQDGRSVERSMLDAARVTTNFAAGGDFTKFLNSHGFTFLNASVQGASQHVRNFREAKQQGLKGYVKVLAKYTAAGLPGVLLNSLMWDDDEEYEELSDYVKQNYYVVAKTEDGKFVRIPKGRTAAVMQNAFEQMEHLVTGDDEADFQTFFELFMNNIAPNNPIENNILAPIGQVMKNEAWYGGDLVPSRLQDLPAAEQFDESTDSISKWLGEKTNTSPYKWNYLLDQYSGGMGDVFLPMLTPEAESGDNSLVGNFLAPWKKEITTDKVLNNKNPGDFYDLKDELEVKSNGKDATEEDAMRTMYMDSVSWEMGDLYAQKREIQSSDLPDDRKYEKVREIQEQINELAKNALNQYDNVSINGAYSEAGDRRYNYDADKDKWYEIKPKNSDGSDNWYYVQEQLSHDKLGMSYADFWNGKKPSSKNLTYYGEYNGKRYNYDAEKSQWYEIRPKNDDGSDNWFYQKEQEVTKGLGISYEEYWSKPKEYNYAYDKPGRYAIAQTVGGYDAYMEHYDALENWQSDSYLAADKDSKGNTINGSRKEKVLAYIDGLDMDYGEKLILYRTVYSSKADKKAYDRDIVKYLNTRNDIGYQDKLSILKELGFEIDSKGKIVWD